MQKKKRLGEETNLRMVIINKEKCKPKKCGQECKRYCPINMQGK